MRGRVALGVSLACTVAATVVVGRYGEASIPWVVALSLAAAAALWIGARTADLSVRHVLLVAVGLRALALPLPPSLSDDGYRYEWDGRVRVEMGASPYAFPPSDHPELDARLLRGMNSPDYISVYPPLSQAVFTAAVWLAGPREALAWPLLKGLLVLGEIVGLVALGRLVRPSALVLYAWHPLSVLEGAGQGHSEILLVGALGVLLWAWTHRPAWTAGALLAAAAVKTWPIALLPVVWRRSGGRAVLGAGTLAVVGALPWVLGADVAGVVRSYGLYAGVFDFYSAPYRLVKAGLWPLLGEGGGRWAALALGTGWVALIGKRWLTTARGGGRPDAFAGLVVAYGVLSAVQHPWHWLSMLAMVPLLQVRFPLYWLLSLSVGTYLAYTRFSVGYDLFLAVGWGGAAVLLVVIHRDALLDRLMRRRARQKWRTLAGLVDLDRLPTLHRVLDLGCGDGYVGDRLAEQTGAAVTLCDVLDLARSPRPLHRTQGARLPFADAAFDRVVLSYVLHHARDPVGLLHEAVRVSRRPIVILETVRGAGWYTPLLHIFDQLANRVRSKNGMEELPPVIRSVSSWQALATEESLSLVVVRRWGRVHPQALFLVTASRTSSGEASA